MNKVIKPSNKMPLLYCGPGLYKTGFLLPNNFIFVVIQKLSGLQRPLSFSGRGMGRGEKKARGGWGKAK